MPEAYNYTGYQTLGYPAYVDTAKDTMLIAESGESYGMRTVEEGFPVPPADGRWEAVKSAPPSPPPPPAKQPVTVPAAPEGGAA